jgi:ATP-dependent DNA helicase RecQ
MTPIYTIGYDGRDFEDLISILKRLDVAYLIDVRSEPVDGAHPAFSRETLAAALRVRNIRYVFMGDTLGDRAAPPECYENGEFSLERLEESERYQEGLGRLVSASSQGLSVALLSAECRPERSHRSQWIGRSLISRGIPFIHVDENSLLRRQEDLMAETSRSAAWQQAAETIASLAPTMEDARNKLKQVFGYDDFLPHQADVVASILERHDTIAIMPTGGGKSLCYQLPALLFPGLTVVVSPLISLMQDQVDQLRDNGVAASFLNSNLSWQEQQRVMSDIRNRRLKLLYVAPESLMREDRLEALEAVRVDCLTIDEAHCISQWGHDFRPEYRQLQEVRRRLPGAVTIAATATATERVRHDIRTSLDMRSPREFIASFNRPNLNLVARERTDGIEQLSAFLRSHHGQSGIVYCLTRNSVEETAETLRQRGYPALPYHAGIDNITRLANQRAFIGDEVPIIVATVAFGMGINKPNVRFVVHFNLPHSLEHYYQEIGRAGRDGRPADCLLLYNDSDLRTIRFINQDKEQWQRDAVEERLQAMLRYARSTRCRRVPLLAYFGERYEESGCSACDTCNRRTSRAGTSGTNAARPRTERLTSERDPRASLRAAVVPADAHQTPYDPALFEYLLSVRKEIAAKAGIPTYRLFSSKSLMEMATVFPRSMDSLKHIEGVDIDMAEKYGQRLVEAVRYYCAMHGLSERRRR